MTAIKRKRGPLRRIIQRARRTWRQRRADVHIISFPKCGRTWLVLMIGRVLQQHHGLKTRNILRLRDFYRPWRSIPYILQHHDGGPEFLLPEELDPDKSNYFGKSVIFLVRDPRDVLVSSYFQKTKRNANFTGSMADYLKQRRGGIETIVGFYNIWARNRHIPARFLLLTYEDLHCDAPAQLRRVLDFIGEDRVSQETVLEAVEYGRFDNMRRLEASNALGSSALAARDAQDPDSFKTRRGEVGAFTKYMDADSLAYVDQIINTRLDPLFQRYRIPAAGEVDHRTGPQEDQGTLR